MYRGPKKIHADRGVQASCIGDPRRYTLIEVTQVFMYRGPKKIHADRGDAGVHV